jgi:hypothetical protein
MTEMESESAGPEVPVEDALEQRTEVTASEPEPEIVDDVVLAESDPADLAEQGRVVDTDDDDYPR